MQLNNCIVQTAEPFNLKLQTMVLRPFLERLAPGTGTVAFQSNLQVKRNLNGSITHILPPVNRMLHASAGLFYYKHQRPTVNQRPKLPSYIKCLFAASQGNSLVTHSSPTALGGAIKQELLLKSME